MNSQTEFKKNDAASYDNLAQTFDHFTDQFAQYAVNEIVARLGSEHQHILDIGCGSGVVALHTAGKHRAAKKITGVDLSEGMLAQASEKSERRGWTDNLVFEKGDAENLAFDDCSFDAAVSLYAFRHFPNPEKAAEELFRVLRPGGRAVIAVGSAPKLASISGVKALWNRPWRALRQSWQLELAACDQIERLVDTELNALEMGEEAEWTHGHHGFSGSIESLLRNAGFTIQSSKWVGESYKIASVSDFWELQSTFSSRARKRLGNASEDDVKRVRAKFEQECERVLERGGSLVYRVGAAIVTGDR